MVKTKQEILAEEFATQLMGLGEWSEKWLYADKYMWQTIKRSYIAGYFAKWNEHIEEVEDEMFYAIEQVYDGPDTNWGTYYRAMAKECAAIADRYYRKPGISKPQTVEQQIESIKKITAEVCKTPEAAKKFLEDAGIIEYDYKGRLSDTENLMQMSGREGEVTTAVTNKLTVDEIKTFLAEYFDDEPDEEQIKLLQAFQTINENKL